MNLSHFSKILIKINFKGTRDIVSIDAKENRLLFLSNEADLEQDTISFRKSLLKRSFFLSYLFSYPSKNGRTYNVVWTTTMLLQS